MKEQLAAKAEICPVGGPGRFFLGRAEFLAPELTGAYGGKVKLIYMDPPFGTGDAFHIKPMGAKEKLVVPVYLDKLAEADYMAMMRAVLTACRELLAPDGSIYLHIDYRMNAKLRLLMDEIFGEANFLNEIVWTYKSGGRSLKHYARKHDTILFYRKSPAVYFNIAAVGIPRGPQKRNNMKRTVDENGRVCFSIRSGGKTYTYYEDTPIFPSDVWDDIEHMHQRDPERTGFATQKPEALLRRMILASSREGISWRISSPAAARRRPRPRPLAGATSPPTLPPPPWACCAAACLRATAKALCSQRPWKCVSTTPKCPPPRSMPPAT